VFAVVKVTFFSSLKSWGFDASKRQKDVYLLEQDCTSRTPSQKTPKAAYLTEALPQPYAQHFTRTAPRSVPSLRDSP